MHAAHEYSTDFTSRKRALCGYILRAQFTKMTFLGIALKRKEIVKHKGSKGQNQSYENMWHNNKKPSHYDT